MLRRTGGDWCWPCLPTEPSCAGCRRARGPAWSTPPVGVDETDQGVVCPIEDATRREALMDRAVRIQWRALAGATIIVGILLLVP